MSATIIDGKAVAAALREEVARNAAALAALMGRPPGLAVVLVGNDPASEVYVASKVRFTREAGMASFEHRLKAETGEADLLALVRRLNDDPAVDGILVQLPLPRHIDSGRVILAIDPAKDVDGLHPENAGRLATSLPGLVPCTPLGSMRLLRTVRPDLPGARAVVIGRSNLVGKPMAQLLLRENATVTVCHSRTRDLPEVASRADVLVVALGRRETIGAEHVKGGAVVVDVGIHRREEGGLAGDVRFDEVEPKASAITPVPGGVGPMTRAMLLHNALQAARATPA